MRSVIALVSLFALAGRAMAQLNITLGTTNFTASQVVSFTQSVVLTDCQTVCPPAQSAIQQCGDDDVSCLCTNQTISTVFTCEQCLFNSSIARNVPMPDMLTGSQPVLTAYAAACAANPNNITLDKTLTTLVLPPTWEGPTDEGLGLAGGAITVGIGAILGVSLITVLNTM